MGDIALTNKDYKMAVRQYTKGIELTSEPVGGRRRSWVVSKAPDSNKHTLLNNRSRAYLEMGQIKNCLADCDAAIKVDPTFVD